MKMKDIRVLFCVISLVVTGCFFYDVSSAATDFTAKAKAAIAVDAESGKIFYEKDADTPFAIASMTKMLSLYLVLEEVDKGTLSWDDQVSISEFAYYVSHDPSLSNVALSMDQTYSVRDLYNAAAIESANAATIALAEKISGSEPKFVDLMRAKLKSWGINDASIVTSSGLNNEDLGDNIYPGSAPNEENVMSAKDMAILAQHLITDYPEYLETASAQNLTFAAGTATEVVLKNWNRMLPGQSDYKEGVDGLKTGTTDQAGQCFTGTIERDGWRIITVVMDADTISEGTTARFQATSEIMDYVMANWDEKVIYKKNSEINGIDKMNVKDGVQDTVKLVVEKKVSLWLQSGMDTNDLVTNYTPRKKVVSDTNILNAPVEKGEIVGELTIQNPKDTLGFLYPTELPTYNLATENEVVRVSQIELFGRKVKKAVSNVVASVQDKLPF